ncbi:energy transducer TonB [Chlamydiota bacterium]
MPQLYHNVWLLKDRMFYIALIISLFWHVSLFSFISIQNITGTSSSAKEIKVTFLQNKWTDKSIDLPGKAFFKNIDNFFIKQSFYHKNPLDTLQNRITSLPSPTQLNQTLYAQLPDIKQISANQFFFDKSLEEMPLFDEHKKQFNIIFSENHLTNIIKNNKMSTSTPQRSGQLHYTMHGINQSRELLYQKDPLLPDWVEAMGITFSLELQVWIDKNGFIKSVLLNRSSGYAELDSLFVKTIGQWRYEPINTKSKSGLHTGKIVYTYSGKVGES